MNEYKIITLREQPELASTAAEWFQSKWGVFKIKSTCNLY